MDVVERMIKNDVDTCLFPFFWLSGSEKKEDLEAAVERVKEANCKALCVEPRGYETFSENWWWQIDVILNKAKELGLKVMIVDEDTKVPTGHAYGKVFEEQYKHLRRKVLVEVHTDLRGPKRTDLVVGETMPHAVDWVENHDKLIGAYAYPKTDDKNGIDLLKVVNLTENIKDGILSWNVPDGLYRVFFIYETYKYSELHKDDFIEFMNGESVDLLINYVYEDYKKRYGEYFGNTLIGFFSDEPSIGGTFNFSGPPCRWKDTKIGYPGQSIPYVDEIKAILDKDFDGDCVKYFPALWYYDEKISSIIRPKYMDAVSKLYKKNFSTKVGAWCKANGLKYTGHILEDNNLHCKYGHSAGHYFRSQQGQDAPGMDIVLDQVLPGASDYFRPGNASDDSDGAFYHYILCKLASSAAHTYPEFNGTAMCENTIGYGWAEGSQLAKWLYDFCIVRGINRFVPGSIRPVLDNVHAPHFGDKDGIEPQFEAMKKVYDYINKTIMLLKGTHVANAAILYHAQAEWASGDESNYMFMQEPAKVLYDNHIDFDIFSEDLLDLATVRNGKLKVHTAEYNALIVPYAKVWPEWVLNKLNELQLKGVKVYFIDDLSENCNLRFKVVKLDKLAKLFNKNKWTDVKIEDARLVRHMHLVDGARDIYMFFNEDPINTIKFTVKTGLVGNANIYDVMAGKQYSYDSNGTLKLTLAPYESVIVIYEQDRGFKPYTYYLDLDAKKVNGSVKVDLYNYKDMTKLTESFTQENIDAISSKYPTFSGKIVYTGEFKAKKTETAILAFENVGENAELILNGVNCGMRPCKPFSFDVSKALKAGNNTYELVVRTTLANAIKDAVSVHTPLEPTGASGDVILYTK